MMLACLIIAPALGAVLAWRSEQVHPDAPRWVALATLAAMLVLTIVVAIQGGGDPWLA
jgi:NADH-quinone oxidoreductase subunit M